MTIEQRERLEKWKKILYDAWKHIEFFNGNNKQNKQNVESMTKEQREKLEKWEKVLYNAWKNDYVHLKSNEFNEIAEIYAELFTPLRVGQKNCNSCRLTALKKLAGEYFKEDNTNKKRAGRPKKIKDGEESDN